MTLEDQFDALPDQIQERLLRIVEGTTNMSARERATASQVFGGAIQAFALYGSDDAIAGAQLLSDCVDLLLLADREERRATERQAL